MNSASEKDDAIKVMKEEKADRSAARSRGDLFSLLSLFTYTIAHFFTDFACAFLIFRLVRLNVFSPENTVAVFILYNCLAFGLECLIGLFFNAETARYSSVFGSLLLIASLLIGMLVAETALVQVDVSDNVISWLGLTRETSRLESFSIAACILAGVGNAFFHIGGGIDSLTQNRGKFWRSGVFISSGALGLALGIRYGQDPDSLLSFADVVLATCLCAACLWLFCRYRSCNSILGSEIGDVESLSTIELRRALGDITVGGVLLFVVFSRSASGFLAPTLWNISHDVAFDGLMIASASFLGKFVGGFCADLFGPRTVGFLALLLSVPLLCFDVRPELFLTGVLLLNTSTAITLTAVAQKCGRRTGFAFGLTTLALLAGFWFYDWLDGRLASLDCFTETTMVVAGMLVASAVGLLFCFKRRYVWKMR